MKHSLVFIFLLTTLLFSACRNEGRQPSDKNLLYLDSTAIEGWDVAPAAALHIPKYSVMKNGPEWYVHLPDGAHGLADPGYLRRSLSHLANFRAKEEINTAYANWDTMSVTDRGTHLNVHSRGKTAARFIIGKLVFEGTKAAYYVRPESEKTVYIVPLYLEGSLIAGPDKLRQKDLVPVAIGQVADIKFLAPEGIRYTLHHDAEKGWMVDDRPADNQRVAAYFQALHVLQIKQFSQQPVTGAVHSLMITGTDGSMVQVRASKKNSDTWVLSSPENPGNYTEISEPSLNSLFPDKTFFLPKK